jgi:hypothetical protein
MLSLPGRCMLMFAPYTSWINHSHQFLRTRFYSWCFSTCDYAQKASSVFRVKIFAHPWSTVNVFRLICHWGSLFAWRSVFTLHVWHVWQRSCHNHSFHKQTVWILLLLIYILHAFLKTVNVLWRWILSLTVSRVSKWLVGTRTRTWPASSLRHFGR